MSRKEIPELLLEALSHYVVDQHQEAVDAIEACIRPGDRDVYRRLCAIYLGLAGVVVEIDVPKGNGFTSLEVIDLTGKGKNVDDMANDPTMVVPLWCMRFVAAAANKDFDTAFAMVGSLPNAVFAGDALAWMLKLAGDSTKALIEREKSK